MICNNCGAEVDLLPVEHHGLTGVVAPDGTAERSTEHGLLCPTCKVVIAEWEYLKADYDVWKR